MKILFSQYFFTFLLIAFAFTANAQNDSLNRALLVAKEDTTKVNLYIKIAWRHQDNDSVIFYSSKGLSLAKKISFSKGEIICLYNIGQAYDSKGDIPEAGIYYQKGLAISREMGDEQGIMTGLGNMANVYYAQNDFRAELRCHLEVLALSSKFQYLNQRIAVMTNIGKAYVALKQLDSAEYYFTRVEKQLEAKGVVNGLKAWLYNCYAVLRTEQRRLDEALVLSYKALAIYQHEQDNHRVTEVYNDIAKIYTGKIQFDSALSYARNSYEYGKSEPDSIDHTMQSGLQLSIIYEKMNNPVEALKYYKIYTLAKDSLYNHEKMTKLSTIVFREQQAKAEIEAARRLYKSHLFFYLAAGGGVVLLSIALLLYRNNRQKQKINHDLEKEKGKVEATLTELKSTQSQLIQSEKMASLGELTAGIAHEIQNPLNFVNNFSEVSRELIEELKVGKGKLKEEEEQEILNDIDSNLEKITHHGKRADAIVKGMLQHSQSNKGQKEPTDINALVGEYLRLSYHGLRAKDKSFNATLKTDLDPTIGKIKIIPQDIGRVLLNLLNNAFYAVNEKHKQTLSDYDSTVTVITKTKKAPSGDLGVIITITDNGNGIPQNIADKIFQPFFTTKPTGQGTGLGLSLSYDIITKGHGGTLKMETRVDEGSTFIVHLPI